MAEPLGYFVLSFSEATVALAEAAIAASQGELTEPVVMRKRQAGYWMKQSVSSVGTAS
jgi:hypothetical protein